jgi:hypothetical protein
MPLRMVMAGAYADIPIKSRCSLRTERNCALSTPLSEDDNDGQV